MLKDKSLDLCHRDNAANRLMYYSSTKECEAAFDAIYEIVIDDSEDTDFREELAGFLGSMWADIGIDNIKLDKIPSRYKKCLLKGL